MLTHDGTVLGALPPLSLPVPWWPETHDVVAAARERFGLDVVVLRLLATRSEQPFGGEVTYLAETDRPPAVALVPWSDDLLADHPLRMPWARPGGPASLLRWADAQLTSRGLERTGPAQQVRSWNLSGIWRLPTAEGAVWFKVVPSFFAHEGAAVEWWGHPPGRGSWRTHPGASCSPKRRASPTTALVVLPSSRWCGC